VHLNSNVLNSDLRHNDVLLLKFRL